MVPPATTPAPPPRSPFAWLWPDRHLPEVLLASEIGPVVFQALLLDGVARRVRGDVAIPAGVAETPGVRALAAQHLVPRRAVVGRASAVWVHTGGASPDRIDVLVAPAARRPDPHAERVTHECALPPSDVVMVGPVRVTSVQRTAIDIGRWSPPAQATPLVRRLATLAALDVRGTERRLDGITGHRGVRSAREVLAAIGTGQAGATVVVP